MLESRTLTCQLADTGVFLPSLAVREMTPAGTACLGPPLTVSLDSRKGDAEVGVVLRGRVGEGVSVRVRAVTI